MCDTAATIYSNVLSRLGSPTDDLLDKTELGYMLFSWMRLRFESIRQSEQSVAIMKTAEFTLGNNENSVDLTALADDFVIPMWCERQVVNLTASHPVWMLVPTVALPQLSERRQEMYPSVSFHGSSSTEVIAEFSYYGNEIATPSRIHRVWYAPTVPLPTSENGMIDLPNNMSNLLVLDVMTSAIPLMQVNATDQLADADESRSKALQAKMQAWDRLLVSITLEREQFLYWFDQWRKESRGSHVARRRRDVMRGRRPIGNVVGGIITGNNN